MHGYGLTRIGCPGCGQPVRVTEWNRDENCCRACGFKKEDARRGQLPDRKTEKQLARERKRTEREAVTNTALKDILARIPSSVGTQDRLDPPHICEISDKINRRFGSTDRFVDTLVEQVEAAIASESGKGSKRVLDAMFKIVNLHAESSRQRESAPDVQQMTDDQLNEVLQQAAIKMLIDNPDVLREIASQSGYELVPKSLILQEAAEVANGGY